VLAAAICMRQMGLRRAGAFLEVMSRQLILEVMSCLLDITCTGCV